MIGGMAPNDIETLWKQIIKDDCWIWTGRVSPTTGYGLWSWHSKTSNTHAFVYQLLQGPIPPGKELHHRCRNRRCCNPEHLEALTRSEHRLLEPHTNGNETRTHCPAGHPYDATNTGRYGRHKERRHCKACARKRALARYYRMKGT
jgi:HNH endonuclease